MPEANWREEMIARERRQLAARHRKGQFWGALAALFGGSRLGYALYHGGPQGEGGFYLGQLAGWIASLLLLIVGLYYVFRKFNEPTMSAEPIDLKDLEPLQIVRNRPVPPGAAQLFLRTCLKPWASLVALGLVLGGGGTYCAIESGGPTFTAMIVSGVALCCTGLLVKRFAGQ